MFFSTRRTFLKYSCLAAAVSLFHPTVTWATNDKSATPPQPVSLSLFNTHTDERLTVAYRTPTGDYDPTALAELDRLLRCHYTNEIHPIDPRTLDYLALLDQQFGGSHEIHI